MLTKWILEPSSIFFFAYISFVLFVITEKCIFTINSCEDNTNNTTNTPATTSDNIRAGGLSSSGAIFAASYSDGRRYV